MFKNKNIKHVKMTIYRYGKLQELETRKDGIHNYIDQVKRGLFINIDKKSGLFIYQAELKKEVFRATRLYYTISLAHQQNAILMAFRWRAVDGSLIVVFGSFLPSSN